MASFVALDDESGGVVVIGAEFFPGVILFAVGVGNLDGDLEVVDFIGLEVDAADESGGGGEEEVVLAGADIGSVSDEVFFMEFGWFVAFDIALALFVEDDGGSGVADADLFERFPRCEVEDEEVFAVEAVGMLFVDVVAAFEVEAFTFPDEVVFVVEF